MRFESICTRNLLEYKGLNQSQYLLYLQEVLVVQSLPWLLGNQILRDLLVCQGLQLVHVGPK